MSKLSDLPAWGQLVLALATMLVLGTLAYASVKEDISLLQQNDNNFEKSILRMEQMMREEMDRHHPRGSHP